MHLHSTYLLSLGAASAALCFAVALAVPATIAGPRANASVEPRRFDTAMFDAGTFQMVNRASKGDRLRVIVRPPDAAPFEVQVPGGSSPKSLDGCESAFGQMDHSTAARLAQTCTT
jgi:ABC-type amino acid transport substrate-binding protein